MLHGQQNFKFSITSDSFYLSFYFLIFSSIFPLTFIYFELLPDIFPIFHGLFVKRDVTLVRTAGVRICLKKASSSCKVNFGDSVMHQTKCTAMCSVRYSYCIM